MAHDERKLPVEGRALLRYETLFDWKSEYDLGIPIIDAQHRGLAAALNSLHFAIVNHLGDTMLDPTIEMVKAYAGVHFTTEELLFRQCGYPDAERHAALQTAGDDVREGPGEPVQSGCRRVSGFSEKLADHPRPARRSRLSELFFKGAGRWRNQQALRFSCSRLIGSKLYTKRPICRMRSPGSRATGGMSIRVWHPDASRVAARAHDTIT